MTRVDISAGEPDELAQALSLAIEVLSGGEPIIIPTDTVYGLAVAASDSAGRERIFALKRRPSAQTLAILVADVEQAGTLVEIDPIFERIAAAYWPGALTIVAPPSETANPSLGAEDGWIGVRSPRQAWVRQLAAAVGPLAATSANLHGEPTPSDITALGTAFPATTLFDAGPGGTVASTVIRCETTGSQPFSVLREGGVSPSEIVAFLDEYGSAGEEPAR